MAEALGGALLTFVPLHRITNIKDKIRIQK